MILMTIRKIWSFVKTHWYIPVAIVIAVVLFFISKGNSTGLFDIITKSRESHLKEVDKLNEIHAEEIEKRDVAIKKYNKTVEAVEKQYKEENKALNRKKKKQIKKIVDEVGEDPNELAKRISEATGFDIVLPEN